MLHTNFKLRNTLQQAGNQKLLIEGETINKIANNKKKERKKRKRWKHDTH